MVRRFYPFEKNTCIMWQLSDLCQYLGQMKIRTLILKVWCKPLQDSCEANYILDRALGLKLLNLVLEKLIFIMIMPLLMKANIHYVIITGLIY